MMPPLLLGPLGMFMTVPLQIDAVRAMLLSARVCAVWMAPGLGFQPLALAIRSLLPAPSLVWPWGRNRDVVAGHARQQWCLNRCHRRPQLAAFGGAADRDAFVFD